MATATKNKLLSKISKMMPSIPIGPPLPKRELIKLLKRMRKALDQLIAALEKEDKPAARKAAPRRRRPASSK
ncbi:MAG: hypothetical protein WC809_19675 [Sinimarinibacterium sp.]|jgi:hypothetical protein